mmetsp:Transcript_102579/g.180806  ORF Transcript_102579/g.180806 Transcript_102579/m.180806 type:complete len:94 (+) Transcript_102579:3-284(+)
MSQQLQRRSNVSERFESGEQDNLAELLMHEEHSSLIEHAVTARPGTRKWRSLRESMSSRRNSDRREDSIMVRVNSERIAEGNVMVSERSMPRF